MGDDQGHGIGSLSPGMYEVDAQVIHGGSEVIEGVKKGLLLPPVKFGAPVFHQLLDVGQVRTVSPVRAGNLVGPAGTGQPVSQVVKDRIGDMHLEGGYIHIATAI